MIGVILNINNHNMIGVIFTFTVLQILISPFLVCRCIPAAKVFENYLSCTPNL